MSPHLLLPLKTLMMLTKIALPQMYAAYPTSWQPHRETNSIYSLEQLTLLIILSPQVRMENNSSSSL